MAGATEIGVLANTGQGFRPQNARDRHAEPSHIRTLPVIDNSMPHGQNVRTSVDCYVSGQYVQRNGKSLSVTQRYSIFVSYGRESQVNTLKEVRERVAADFQERYGGTFNITTIHVPDLKTPVDVPNYGDDMNLYGGSQSFKRQLGNYEKMRLDVGTERLKERLNVGSIRNRYGFGRR